MGTFSLWHWLIVLAVVLIIFGAGKLPKVMGDFGKGIKNFKEGLKEQEAAEEAKKLEEEKAKAEAARTASTEAPRSAEPIRGESAPRG